MFLKEIEQIGMKNADNKGTVTGHYDHNILTSVKVMI
tara:strand:+ start:268 stop:378 length:111 start_codon:yes stop_codon:yes gene_type:complete